MPSYISFKIATLKNEDPKNSINKRSKESKQENKPTCTIRVSRRIALPNISSMTLMDIRKAVGSTLKCPVLFRKHFFKHSCETLFQQKNKYGPFLQYIKSPKWWLSVFCAVFYQSISSFFLTRLQPSESNFERSRVRTTPANERCCFRIVQVRPFADKCSYCGKDHQDAHAFCTRSQSAFLLQRDCVGRCCPGWWSSKRLEKYTRGWIRTTAICPCGVPS